MEGLSRTHSRQLSLPSSSSSLSLNKVVLQPASPEVISNLISSLSSISAPGEDSDVPPFPSPLPPSGPHICPNRQNDTCSNRLPRIGLGRSSPEKQEMRQPDREPHKNDTLASAFLSTNPTPIPDNAESNSSPTLTSRPDLLSKSLGSSIRLVSAEDSSENANIGNLSIRNLSIEPNHRSFVASTNSKSEVSRKKDRRKTHKNSTESSPAKKKIHSRTSTADSWNEFEPNTGAISASETNVIWDKSSKGRCRKEGDMSSVPISSRNSPGIHSASSTSPSFYEQGEHEAARESNNYNFKSTSISVSSMYLDDTELLDPSLRANKILFGNRSTSPSRIYPSVSERTNHRSREWRKSSRNNAYHRKSQQSVSINPSKTGRNSRTVSSESGANEERPKSADSIHYAVQAYLCSPRLSQKIRHPQTGRTISFSEVGDSEGFVVFCCVGMGLTRYITAFYDELALTLKLRLITPDRPGVGESEPYSDGTSTPLCWPDDVYAICQALKINKFSILAHSAGAIYALATALRMPQHIRGRIHLLAPWIPPSQMCVIGGQVDSPPNNSLPTSQRILRALPTPILKAANSGFMSAASSSMISSLPKQRRNKRKSNGRDVSLSNGKSPLDKENNGGNDPVYFEPTEAQMNDTSEVYLDSEVDILAASANSLAFKERKNDYESRLTNAIWNLSTQGANPAVDLLVCLERQHTIGFRYVDITRAVVIHHGSKDNRVPVENVIWMGKTMKRCEVRVIQGEGHSLMTSASIMSSILTEIARDWEDWTKLTNSPGASRSDKSLKI